jgi:hypothetical protein
MAKQEVTAVQVQMAASAGVKLLQVDDLPVPMHIAKSGALSVLEGLLGALASGEVVLAPPPPQNPQVAEAVAAAVKPPVPPVVAAAAENNGGDAEVPPIAPVESTEAGPTE